jgi:hypothetical protein
MSGQNPAERKPVSLPKQIGAGGQLWAKVGNKPAPIVHSES